MKYDVFISHASEDKLDVVWPLTQHLVKLGLRVWVDDFELTLGDSLRRSVDRGLIESRFGIVILSPAFFRKEWPKRELDGLVAKDDSSEKVILPIWHNVTKDDVTRFSPILADKLAVSTERGIENVAQQVFRAVQRQDRYDVSKSDYQNLDNRKVEELSQIRRKLISASSIRDLREAFYKVDEFLSKYPHYYEARLLKDEIQVAINRERPATKAAKPKPSLPPMAKAPSMLKRFLFGIPILGGLSYLLYLLIRWILEFLR